MSCPLIGECLIGIAYALHAAPAHWQLAVVLKDPFPGKVVQNKLYYDGCRSESCHHNEDIYWKFDGKGRLLGRNQVHSFEVVWAGGKRKGRFQFKKGGHMDFSTNMGFQAIGTCQATCLKDILKVAEGVPMPDESKAQNCQGFVQLLISRLDGSVDGLQVSPQWPQLAQDVLDKQAPIIYEDTFGKHR